MVTTWDGELDAPTNPTWMGPNVEVTVDTVATLNTSRGAVLSGRTSAYIRYGVARVRLCGLHPTRHAKRVGPLLFAVLVKGLCAPGQSLL